MKKILTINPGSTSTKFKVYNAKGDVLSEETFTLKQEKKQLKFLNNITNLEKIAIRVVHGGDIYQTSKITKEIKNKIFEYIDFAPIHNKRTLDVIESIEKIFPQKTLYACFDTAFHTTIPLEHFTYPISKKISKKYNIKKYGFHGLALQSSLEKFKEKRKKQGLKIPKNIIFAHLGGGASITAVKNGKSFITSMELTPLSGIPMVTRSGNIDLNIFSILEKKGLSNKEISSLLNNESGFYGLTGSKDIKKIIEKAVLGKKQEKLAFDIFVSAIVQIIFAYTGLMQGIDAVVFSGGIGYGNADLRNTIYKKIKILGLQKKDMYRIDVDEEWVMFNQLKKIK